MAELRFGLRVPSGLAPDIDDLRRFVIEAERFGFASLWVGDHVFHHTDVLQPLDLLSWMAANTENMRLGTSVVLAAYLHPVLLAKSAATVDYLSGGRLTLGISLGGSQDEYASLGVSMKQRLGRLLESTHLMRRLWTEDDVSHAGRYFQVQHGNVRPRPAQHGGIPIYYAARERPMLDRIPVHADGWVASSHYPLPSFLVGAARVRQQAQVHGLAPDAIGVAKVHDVSVHADSDEARRRAAVHWQRYYGPSHDIETSTTYGTPAECAEQLAAYRQTDVALVDMILEPTSLAVDELRLLAETVKLAEAP